MCVSYRDSGMFPKSRLTTTQSAAASRGRALIHIPVYQNNLGHRCWTHPLLMGHELLIQKEVVIEILETLSLCPTVISPSYSQAEKGQLSLYLIWLTGIFSFLRSLSAPAGSLSVSLLLLCRVYSSSFRVIAIHLTSSRPFLSQLPQREREGVYVSRNTASQIPTGRMCGGWERRRGKSCVFVWWEWEHV